MVGRRLPIATVSVSASCMNALWAHLGDRRLSCLPSLLGCGGGHIGNWELCEPAKEMSAKSGVAWLTLGSDKHQNW